MIRTALWLVGLAVVAIGLLLLVAAHWPWLGRQEVVLAVRSMAHFPELALRRDSRCSVGDAIRHMTVGRLAEEGALERASKLLALQGSLVHLSTRLGDYWVPARDRPGFFDTVFEVGSNVYSSGAVAVRPGDVVLDCGASFGVTVRWELAHGAKLVVAIEPAPQPLQCLRRNLDREIAEGRVIVYPKGVWDRDAELELTVDPELASTAASVAINRGQPGVKVPLTTIDKLVAELKLQRVDFIKMDIEGAEAQALRGAVATVSKFRPRMAISLEHRPTDPDTLTALVEHLWPGYAVHCGECENIDGHLQPEVLFAGPAR